MKNNKTFEIAGFVGIAIFFAGAFAVYFTLFRQIIHFVLSLQPAGISH